MNEQIRRAQKERKMVKKRNEKNMRKRGSNGGTSMVDGGPESHA